MMISDELMVALVEEGIKIVNECKLYDLNRLLDSIRPSNCQKAIAIVEEEILSCITVASEVNDPSKQ